MTTPRDDNPAATSLEASAPPGTASQHAVPRPRSGSPAGGPQEELAQSQAEVAALRAKLDTRTRRQRRRRTARGVIAAILVALAAVTATASVVGVWAARTTLNTDRWVSTVAPLAEDPQVQAAM